MKNFSFKKIALLFFVILDLFRNLNLLLNNFTSFHGRTGVGRYPAQLNLHLDPGSEAGTTCLHRHNVGLKRGLLFQLISSFCFLTQLYSHEVQRPVLNELLQDLKSYKVTCRHRGDLYEHSMWLEQYLSCFLNGKKENSIVPDAVIKWHKDFSDREKFVMCIGGLIHDVGKAGDLDFSQFSAYENFQKKDGFIYFFTKLNHERIGFEYIMYDIDDKLVFKKGYTKVNGTSFDFKKLFEEFGLTKKEQIEVALLIASHRMFNECVMRNDVDAKNVIQRLKNLVAETKSDFDVDRQFIKKMILVNIADICATYFPLEKEVKSFVFGKSTICKAVRIYSAKDEETRKELEQIEQQSKIIMTKVNDLFFDLDEKYEVHVGAEILAVAA